MIINVVVNLYGLDKVGDLYGLQGLAIAKELGLLEGNEHISNERERHDTNSTAWCFFSIDTYVILSSLRIWDTDLLTPDILIGISSVPPSWRNPPNLLCPIRQRIHHRTANCNTDIHRVPRSRGHTPQSTSRRKWNTSLFSMR